MMFQKKIVSPKRTIVKGFSVKSYNKSGLRVDGGRPSLSTYSPSLFTGQRDYQQSY